MTQRSTSTPPCARNWSSCWYGSWNASRADQTSAHVFAAWARVPASSSRSRDEKTASGPPLCCSMSSASSTAARRSSSRSRTPVNTRRADVPPGVWDGGKSFGRSSRVSGSIRRWAEDVSLLPRRRLTSASRMASTTSCPGEGLTGGRAGLVGGVFLTAIGGGGGGRPIA